MYEKELDILIGLDNTEPDIQIGTEEQTPEISLTLSDSGVPANAARIEVRTTAEWNERMMYIPKVGRIIVYSDRNVIDGVAYPGVKIGDGLAYVVDLPFVGDDVASRIMSLIEEHIQNDQIHVTEAERAFWNNKINYEMDDSGETLIINRD